MQPKEEKRRRWWHSRLESVPSSVLKRFRSNFEVAGGRQGEEGPALLERFREHNRQVKRSALIKLRYDVCAGLLFLLRREILRDFLIKSYTQVTLSPPPPTMSSANSSARRRPFKRNRLDVTSIKFPLLRFQRQTTE